MKNRIYTRAEDCVAMHGMFDGSFWVRNEMDDGTNLYSVPDVPGSMVVKAAALSEATVYLACEAEFDTAYRLHRPHAHEQLGILCCIEGGGEVVDGPTTFQFQKGDLFFTGSLFGDGPFTESQVFPAHQPCVMAGFFCMTDQEPLVRDCIRQEVMRAALTKLGGADGISRPIRIPELEYTFYHTYHERQLNSRARLLMLRSSVLRIASQLVEWCEEPHPGAPVNQYEREMLWKARKRIMSDFSNPPTIAQIAREVGMNETKLKRDFKSVYGEPIYQCFKKAKLQEAMNLLLSTDQSVREIAFRCGYTSQGQFSAAFRQIYGVTPMEARKKPITVDRKKQQT